MHTNDYVERLLTFSSDFTRWKEKTLNDARRDQTFFLPPIVVSRHFYYAKLQAAWLQFEHVSTEKCSPEGCWTEATFHYTAWYFDWQATSPCPVWQRIIKGYRLPYVHISSTSFKHRFEHIAIDGDEILIRERKTRDLKVSHPLYKVYCRASRPEPERVYHRVRRPKSELS